MRSATDVRRALKKSVPNACLVLPKKEESAEAGDYPKTTLWSVPDEDAVDDADDDGFLQNPSCGTKEEAATNAAAASGEESTEDVSAGAPRFEFAPEADNDAERALGSRVGGEILRAALVKEGIDGLASYLSFHAHGRQWGIYLPLSSIFFVAKEVFGATMLNLSGKMRLAAHIMHQHELFHFAVDYMTALWELIHKRPCWKPGRNLRSRLGYYELEEQLANAHMLRRINAVPSEIKLRGRARALRNFIKDQPPGYKDAAEIRESDVFREACMRLCMDYVKQCKEEEEEFLEEERFRPIFTELLMLDHRLDWRNCPVHIVHDEQRFSLPTFWAALFTFVKRVNETEDFLKQLDKCDSRIQKDWKNTKRKLAQSVRARGLDFKLWERQGDSKVFSVRVNDNFRAHLLYELDQSWTASRIGSHEAMGHG